MERTLRLDYLAAIPVGHRVEVTQFAESAAVADLDTGIRYLPSEEATDDTSAVRWGGVVLACTVAPGTERPHTTLVIGEAPTDAVPPRGAEDRPAAAEALEALDGADAALAAAKAEALRWSSMPSSLPPPRP